MIHLSIIPLIEYELLPLNTSSYAAPLPESLSSETLKIATFNLLNYLEPPFAFYDFENIYSNENWQKKQQWIREYLKEYQPDIIGFQEVFSPDALKKLVGLEGYTYFEVVAQPDIIDGYIYQSPVVAIASRYPITEVEPVPFDSDLATAMGLSANAQFSRPPLRATVDLPHIGLCDCYVVHLKSKRPKELTENMDEELAPPTALDTLKAEVAGRWASDLLRGTEATQLYLAMLEQRKKSNRPMILMGDFNDTLTNGVVSPLLTHSVRGPNSSEINTEIAKYKLKDAFDLYQHTNHCPEGFKRAATHYFLSRGSVLDYILLSSEFDAEHTTSLLEVCQYHTYDRHLINPYFERDGHSTDHAIVTITLAFRH